MIEKININGVEYAVTPVTEGEAANGVTVKVDGVTYLLGEPIVAPAASSGSQAIEKVQVNGVVYDIADVEGVEAEAQRAQDAEWALQEALQNGLNQEATARGNLAKEIRANAMQYDTLGVYVRADKAEIYGQSIDTTPRVVEFPAATTEKAGVMSAEDKKKVNASIKDIVVNPNVDDVELDLEDNTEKTSHVAFPAATTERAGVMSAADKVALDTATSRALRALFVAAGAEYNDTSADKTKTAPWGETVIHKAGHYYLNGLGDITEEQMMDIYKSVHWSISHNISNMFWGETFRTNFAPMNKGFRELDATDGVLAKGAFMHNISLEVAVVSALDTPYNNIVYGIQVCHAASMFLGCKKLKHIIGILPSGMVADTSTLSTMFGKCLMLENIKLYSVKHNVSFSDSALISKESILYCITNAAPTTAITITLHPNAYARLADDAEIVAALEAQPFISLVSA